LQQGLRLDALVRDVLRAVALALLSALYQGLCRYLVEQAAARGLTMQTRPIVHFKTLYGEVKVESPYLRSSQSGESARPMKDILGVEGEQYRESVQRALVDFGSEKSFARAVVSFEEHYGWQVGRTTLRHQTLQAAQDAVSYLDERLQQATGPYEQAGMAPPQVPVMLMGLDGCEIRTGVSMTAAQAGLSDRPAHQRVRVESWRDVRTGLARPLDGDERLYVCRMDTYDEVLEQLFGVGCLEGMTPRTQVVVPGDGASGLREAVVTVFPGAHYILDHPHLKSHFYETADALGLEEPERHQWVKGYMDQLWACNVDEVLSSLQQQHEEAPNERLRQLINHYGVLKTAWITASTMPAAGHWGRGKSRAPIAICHRRGSRLPVPVGIRPTSTPC
jgi:hypothetical protein